MVAASNPEAHVRNERGPSTTVVCTPYRPLHWRAPARGTPDSNPTEHQRKKPRTLSGAASPQPAYSSDRTSITPPSARWHMRCHRVWYMEFGGFGGLGS